MAFLGSIGSTIASTLTRELILLIFVSVWVRKRKRCHTLLLPSPPKPPLVYLCDPLCEALVFEGSKAQQRRGR